MMLSMLRKGITTMEMTMRWYGSKFDTVTLKQIRQTAYVTGVITMLMTSSRVSSGPRKRSML